MPSSFNPGDRVRCVEGQSSTYLNAGQEYLIRTSRPHSWERGVEVVEVHGLAAAFYSRRFVLVEAAEPPKIKTTDTNHKIGVPKGKLP